MLIRWQCLTAFDGGGDVTSANMVFDSGGERRQRAWAFDCSDGGRRWQVQWTVKTEFDGGGDV